MFLKYSVVSRGEERLEQNSIDCPGQVKGSGSGSPPGMGGRVAALVACCVAAARSTDAPTSLARRGSHISASPARIQVNTRSSVVTTMVPRTTQCPNVTSCAANSNCTSCLLAVAAATNVPTASSTSDTPNEATRASSERYLRALLATEACSVESVAPAVLGSAIEEIEFVPACAESFGFSSGGPMKGCGEVSKDSRWCGRVVRAEKCHLIRGSRISLTPGRLFVLCPPGVQRVSPNAHGQ